MSGLAIQTTRPGDGWELKADGEIDVDSIPGFTKAVEGILDAGEGDLLLDLCDVTFIDSTGLHALLNAQRRLVRQGRRLRVECVSGPVMRLFQLARLVETFGVTVRSDGRP